jgi:hypothetical protein
VVGERTHTVSVRLSPAEYAVWVAAAKAAGRGRLGAWVRDRVTGTLPAATSAGAAGVSGSVSRWLFPASSPASVSAGGPVVSGEWAAGLRAELGRVGNNLNQAVRLANTSGVDPARVGALADTVDRARVVMAELLAAVRTAAAAVPGRAVGVPVVGPGRSLMDQVVAGDAAAVGPVAPSARPVVRGSVREQSRGSGAAERAAGRVAGQVTGTPAAPGAPPAGRTGGLR